MNGKITAFLPADCRAALDAFREGARAAFGTNLFALYIYGALTFPETEGIVDLDYHLILERQPDAGQVQRYVELCATLEREHSPWADDLDGWLIVRERAGTSNPPEHVLHPGARDGAWALHRAHWLAGRCLVLHGPMPAEVVTRPTWEELEADLWGELEFARQSPTDAFAVLNCCRVLHSFLTRNVVVSKFASAYWGLAELPPEFRPTLRAALAVYRRKATAGDTATLQRGRPGLFKYVEDALRP